MTERQAYKLLKTLDSPERFADFCFPTADTVDTRREFFNAINWREGYVYNCSNREYAIKTGYTCVKNWAVSYAMHRASYPSI